MKQILSKFHTRDMILAYILDTETQIVGFTLFPAALEDRFTLDGEWKVESLIQLKRVGDSYPVGFSNGHTMRNSGTCWEMKYVRQTVAEDGGVHIISTFLQSGTLRGIHYASYRMDDQSVTVWTQIENISGQDQRLELLSSFSLCSVFGFSARERTRDFLLHRLRSKWSEEGRLDSRGFLELQLEPSWQKYGAQSIRFGQVGSMPVRRFFPWFVIEDRRFHCMLGGILAIPSSWQLEIFSEDDRPAVSGGLADREFGYWMKRLGPRDSFTTPTAELTCCVGGIDEVSSRITHAQRRNLEQVPAVERDLPIVFNEFCTSWGSPTEERLQGIVEKLAGKGVTYCVIDAGWHADPEKGWESNMGDWKPCQAHFPNGFKAAADRIRAGGMIPGIWFEPETCGKDAEIFQREELLLTRDGYPITTERRRFLDLRKDAVQQYLRERVIECLRENGFGYLKVDYNDSIGLGCDGGDSLGENLREHMAHSQHFYQTVRRELPGLVMENCSSGGHRLEPSMMGLFSMASFSDAHECVSGPIVAANVHRAIQPAQSQIWAVLRPEADEKRLRYVLAGTFLGRMCLSGDVDRLSEQQWRLVEDSIAFYRKCAAVIRDGITFRFGPEVRSYAHPEGYQIVVRAAGGQAMAVIHTFASCQSVVQERIPALAGFQIRDWLGGSEVKPRLDQSGMLHIERMQEFDALVILADCKMPRAGQRGFPQEDLNEFADT